MIRRGLLLSPFVIFSGLFRHPVFPRPFFDEGTKKMTFTGKKE
jgi:hypothetical protein